MLLQPQQLQLHRLGDELERELGGASQAGVPAGARTEGLLFERALAGTWRDFLEMHAPYLEIRRVPTAHNSVSTAVEASNPRNGSQLYIPVDAVTNAESYPMAVQPVPDSWMQKKFMVSELIEAHLGSRVMEFAPPTPRDSALYWGTNYPAIYEGKSTNFDFTIALAQSGVLVEKMLFEYKYAKSSKEQTVDGNAHERLSFQILQYLEIASRYTYCSMNVVSSNSFVKYKNKYHPSFHQQAIRLGDAFRAFTLRMASCHSEYIRMFTSLSEFLLVGTRLPPDFRQP